MVQTILFLSILIIVVGLILAAPRVTQWRRQRLRDRAFPKPWRSILDHNVPLYPRLPESLQRQLCGYIQVFLAEKSFTGCGGLSITDEIKVTIAAQACLLLLGQKERFYPKLNAIFVYPTAFFVNTTESVSGFFVEEKKVARRGESWDQGIVVLSWGDIQYDITHPHDGNNVILHEFAHQLDQEDGLTDGVPILDQRVDRALWAQVLTQSYQLLQRKIEQGANSAIDAYGATNPAEFFAVATETFFEKPAAMERTDPDLYAVLQRYYRLDPARWD